MIVSAGVLIINENEQILGCVPFGRSRYVPNSFDIPKGIIEEHETAIEAAIREVKEETGIVLTNTELHDLGQHVYLKGKDLHIFKCRYDIDIKLLKCSSEFTRNGQSWPEVIGYDWIEKEKINDKFFRSLARLIDELL